MKPLGVAFLFVAIIYGVMSIVQVFQIIATFSIGLSSTGYGISFSHHPLMWLHVILLFGSILQLASAAYIGHVGLRLVKNMTRGILLASIIAILLFPFGTIAGVCGLIVNGRSGRGKEAGTMAE